MSSSRWSSVRRSIRSAAVVGSPLALGLAFALVARSGSRSRRARRAAERFAPAFAGNGFPATTPTRRASLAERAGTKLTVDIGRAVEAGTIAITRPAVLAAPSPRKGRNVGAAPTKSAGELVEVSAGGRVWRALARNATPPQREAISLTSVGSRLPRARPAGPVRPSNIRLPGYLTGLVGKGWSDTLQTRWQRRVHRHGARGRLLNVVWVVAR
jgi:hypothetical protein